MDVSTTPPSAQRTADRLLHEAAALFSAESYSGATTRALATRLGITKASLYHHISTKDELLHRICTESLRRTTSAVRDACENAPAPRRLRTMIQAHMRTMIADRDLFKVGLIEMSRLSEGPRAQVVTMRRDHLRLIEVAIKQDQADGRLRADLDARLLAITLLSLLNWSVFWYDPDGGLTPAELADFFMTVFMNGAAAAEEGADVSDSQPGAQ